MPPKRSPMGNKSKEDVAEKVKEIKQRQKSWFKQRENTLKVNTDGGRSPVMSPTSKTGSQKPARSEAAPNQTTAAKPPNINRATTTVQKGFNSWLRARSEEETNPSSSQDETGGDSDGEYCETESDVTLELASSRADSVTPSVYNGRSQSSSAGSHLAPDQFDALANQIVNRVKRELYVGGGNTAVTAAPPRQEFQFSSDPSVQQEKKLKEARCSTSEALSLGSHYCPQCSKLMVPSIHTPTLAIPCGHTVCKCCSVALDTCPVCGCVISSLTPNIMLQQIIVDYKGRPAEKQPQQSGYSPAKYEGDYREDYNSLVLRCQVLESEAGNIRDNMNSIQRDIDKENRQVTNIKRAEQRTLEEMEELENRLEELRNHRGEYEVKCAELEGRQNAEKSRLKLVQDTLRGLQKEAEKMKLLAGKLDESW